MHKHDKLVTVTFSVTKQKQLKKGKRMKVAAVTHLSEKAHLIRLTTIGAIAITILAGQVSTIIG